MLWIRPLDMPTMLENRAYHRDGSLRLKPGEDTELTLNAAALGSLYLADVSASILREAGRIKAEEAAVELFDELFATPRLPDCRTHFW